jgi:hypothetical protein
MSKLDNFLRDKGAIRYNLGDVVWGKGNYVPELGNVYPTATYVAVNGEGFNNFIDQYSYADGDVELISEIEAKILSQHTKIQTLEGALINLKDDLIKYTNSYDVCNNASKSKAKERCKNHFRDLLQTTNADIVNKNSALATTRIDLNNLNIDLGKAKTDLNNAVTTEAQAKARLELAKKGLTPESVEKAQLALANASAEVARLQASTSSKAKLIVIVGSVLLLGLGAILLLKRN